MEYFVIVNNVSYITLNRQTSNVKLLKAKLKILSCIMCILIKQLALEHEANVPRLYELRNFDYLLFAFSRYIDQVSKILTYARYWK